MNLIYCLRSVYKHNLKVIVGYCFKMQMLLTTDQRGSQVTDG